MAGIAISYRREDTGWITGRIFDRLKEHYEKAQKLGYQKKPVVFMDYDSTPVGVDFRNYIKGVLDDCDILLAVIGPHWEGDDKQSQPRIMDDSDWVRIEVETALKNNIPVVPVLIDRTSMPRADMLPESIRDLVCRQAARVDTQIDFNSHIERLIREIDRLTGVRLPRSAAIQPERLVSDSPRLRPFGPKIAYALALLSLCAVAVALWLTFFGQQRFIEPAYATYHSPGLGVTVLVPNNILTLDTTKENERKLAFRDGNGQPLIQVLRTPIPEHKNPKVGRQSEIADLTRMNFVITYTAPQTGENWTNWYVLSGVNHGTEFYFRRWYSDDSVVSMEFTYGKELAPLFDKLIDRMTHEFTFSSVAPKIDP
jgi:TIR domain